MWSSEDDVSGSKRGIRCEGDGCGPEGEIALMEMNFGDDTHWSKSSLCDDREISNRAANPKQLFTKIGIMI